MEWAHWEPLMFKLKEHKKIGDTCNIELLISKLRQKQLLHRDVPGGTVSDRVEMLVTDLNATMIDSHSDSFIANFLEVLQSIPVFEDLALQYTSDHEFADSKKPEQETDLGNGTDRHFDKTPILTARPSVEAEQKINPALPALAEVRHDVCEISSINESHPQEEYRKEVESLKLRVNELTEKCDKLQRKNDEEVEYFKHKVTTTEKRAELAERAKQEAERQSAQQRRDFQIERSASQNQIQELQLDIMQLKEQLDEAQRKHEWCSEDLQVVQEKVVLLQGRVNLLEQEKEESCSPAASLAVQKRGKATIPIIPLKPFFKDVEQIDKVALGSGSYGSVVKVRCKATGEVFAAKRFRDDFEKKKNFEKKFNTEFTLLHQLKHDHIVCYVGFTQLKDSEFPALLMEQLDTDLHTYLKPKPEQTVTLSEKVHILLGVGKGLEYLHEKDVLHLDLTAKNVLLRVSGAGCYPVAKIADFGNSHIMTTDPRLELESSSGFPGTIMYLPPEARGGRCYNAKIDIFSFGNISLFVCTQTCPFPLLSSTYTITRTDGTTKLSARSEVDRREKYFNQLHNTQYLDLANLMRKCLDNVSDKRPSASEVVCELEGMRTTHVNSPVGEHPKWFQENGEQIDLN